MHQRDQLGHAEEPHLPALAAGSEAQGDRQVGLARAAGLPTSSTFSRVVDPLPLRQFEHERLVDRAAGLAKSNSSSVLAVGNRRP